LLWKHQLSPTNPAAENHNLHVPLRELRASRHVGKAVLMGVDGKYTKDGRLTLQASDFLISNAYSLKHAQEFSTEVLPGLSINPHRIDTTTELHRCVKGGEVLVKVLP
jgi:uncharacterized protein